MLKGILPINKPQNWTSFDVCNKVKHLIKGEKIGHLGTLDPMATGVLLVTVGKATKLFDLMQQKTKTYVATFKFGYETDSLDATGEIVSTTQNLPVESEIKAVLPSFIGEIEQMPPKYGAKMVNGVRAYELASKNAEFELKPCKITINNLEFISFSDCELKVKVSCGSGTYIRSLGRDIAYKLGSLATMTSLIRTQIDTFKVGNCLNIEQLDAENIANYIVPIDKVLNYPILELTEQEKQKILNGMTIISSNEDGIYKLNEGKNTLAIVKIQQNRAKMSIFLG